MPLKRYVSVPEKTLEYWTSQYITSRFSTHAARWWPVDGEDVDIRNFPATASKAQLELKTTTVTGPRRYEVLVELVQLAKYGRLLAWITHVVLECLIVHVFSSRYRLTCPQMPRHAPSLPSHWNAFCPRSRSRRHQRHPVAPSSHVRLLPSTTTATRDL